MKDRRDAVVMQRCGGAIDAGYTTVARRRNLPKNSESDVTEEGSLCCPILMLNDKKTQMVHRKGTE